MASGTQRASTWAVTERLESRTFGEFELLEEIGRGGMGVVYRARHLPSGRRAAVKILPALHGSDAEAVARFEREAAAAARICHPGVVPVHGFGEHETLHWLAMGFVEGVALDHLLGSLRGRDPGQLRGTLAEETGLAELLPAHRRRLTPAHAEQRYARSCAALCAEVAEALHAVHEAGVVHRDVKPGNLLLDRRGRVVVVDFGLALDAGSMRVTRSGDVVGTPCYMAPEQACGHFDIDRRVDVYGLGATLYELLTLRPPFDGVHAADILRRIADEPARPLRSVEPSVPVALARVVDACLEKNPADRPASMVELAAALRAVAAGEDHLVRPPRRLRQRCQRFVRRHSQRLVAIAALALLGLGVAWMLAAADRQRQADAGLQALAGARSHLVAGHFVQAEACYARAEVLLDEQRVVTARQRHLDTLFEGLYARGLHADLARWLVGQEDLVRDASWTQRLARARGRGRLRVAASEGREPTVRARRHGLEGPFKLVDVPRWLPVGDWIVEVQVAGGPALVRRVRIERDTEVTLAATQVAAAAPGVGDAALVPTDAAALWVERHEVTSSRHRRAVEGVDDPALREELLPRDVERAWASSPDLPVLGLAPRDAATLAGLLGGHLPTPETFRQASLAGGRPLRYPWGDDWRDAAAVGGLSPVGARPVGASAAGHADLLGNAAEVVVAADGRRFWLAGGDHRDLAARRAHVDLLVPVAADQALASAGLRLARIAWPARVDPVAAARWRDAEHRRLASGGLRLRWRILPSAAAPLRLEVAPGATRRFELLGAGAARVVADPAHDGARLAVDPNHRDRLSWAADGDHDSVHELLPVGMVRAHAGRLVLRLPPVAVLASASQPPVDPLIELLLPPAAALHLCEPPADAVLHDGDGLRLAWWQPASLRQIDARGALRVELRTDGLWAPTWPSRQRLAGLVQRSRSGAGSAAGSGASARRASGGLRVDLAGALGGLWVAETRVDRATNDPLGRVLWLEDQPWTVWLDARGSRPEVVHTALTRRLDGGVSFAPERYRHPDCGIELTLPDGLRLVRLDEGPWDLQIRLEDDPAEVRRPLPARLQMIGRLRPADAAATTHWVRLESLSGGVVSRAGARLLSDPIERSLRVAGIERVAQCTEWLLPETAGWSRERWWLFDLPGEAGAEVEVLVRVQVRGASPQGAREAFAAADAQAWLDSALAALR